MSHLHSDLLRLQFGTTNLHDLLVQAAIDKHINVSKERNANKMIRRSSNNYKVNGVNIQL